MSPTPANRFKLQVTPPFEWRSGLCAVALSAASAGCSFKHHVVQVPSCVNDAAPLVHHTLELRSLRQAPEIPTCPGGRCVTGEPQVALGIARPALCNDYPVTYRVIQPDTVARVRLVDQFTVTSPTPAP